AVAGLKRINLEKRITQYFPLTDFIPSPGQGALAIVIKKDNTKLATILRKINHLPTLQAVRAERSFSKSIGGGCKMPVGAYAECKDNQLTIHAVVGSLDSIHLEKDTMTGEINKPVALGKKLATRMLKTCQP